MELFRQSLRTNDEFLQTNLYRRAVAGFRHEVGRQPTNRYPVLMDTHARLRGFGRRRDYIRCVLKRKSGHLFRRAFVSSDHFARQALTFVNTFMDQHTVAILPPLFARSPVRRAFCYKVRGRRLVQVSKEDQPDLVFLCFATGPIIPLVRDADALDTKNLNAALSRFYQTDGVTNEEFFQT